MESLTARQQEVFDFVTHCIQERGYPPTMREIAGHIGTSGTISAQRHLEALERKGYIKRSAGSSRGIELINMAQSSIIPIVGVVRAGPLQLAIEDVEGYCAVDSSWAREKGMFLLRVRGDSMVDAHILDGDLALIRPQQVAENGEIVVAMVNGEATLKRFYREGDGSIRLQPENSDMKPIVVLKGETDMVIIGKLLRTIRCFE